MFRKKGDKGASSHEADAAVLAEIERMEALPKIELAIEVLTRGFGPGGPADKPPPLMPGASVLRICEFFAGDRTSFALSAAGLAVRDRSLNDRLNDLVSDSVQALEHASLIRSHGTVGQAGSAFYEITSQGRTALATGTVERALRGQAPFQSDSISPK